MFRNFCFYHNVFNCILSITYSLLKGILPVKCGIYQAAYSGVSWPNSLMSPWNMIMPLLSKWLGYSLTHSNFALSVSHFDHPFGAICKAWLDGLIKTIWKCSKTGTNMSVCFLCLLLTAGLWIITSVMQTEFHFHHLCSDFFLRPYPSRDNPFISPQLTESLSHMQTYFDTLAVWWYEPFQHYGLFIMYRPRSAWAVCGG